MIIKFYLTLFVTCVTSASAWASRPVEHAEVAQSTSLASPSTRVGDCFLSAQKLFKVMTPAGQPMPVLPLEEAMNDPSCPKVRNCAEIEAAYEKSNQQRVLKAFYDPSQYQCTCYTYGGQERYKFTISVPVVGLRAEYRRYCRISENGQTFEGVAICK